VRPGGLTDDPGTGPDTTRGKAFDLLEGDTPIDEAVRSL
jgi:hypothetical protein